MDDPIKYVIVRLDDIHGLLKLCNTRTDSAHMKSVIDRLKNETGGDIQNVVDEMKATGICHVCMTECQEHNCTSIYTNHLGRRLSRLLDRANTARPEYIQIALTRRRAEARALSLRREEKKNKAQLAKDLIDKIEKELSTTLQRVLINELNDESLEIFNRLTTIVMKKYPEHVGGQVTLDSTDSTKSKVAVIQRVKKK